MLNFNKTMTYIRRLSDTIVSVEGVECVKEADGRYYPTLPELANVSLFPDAVDLFLEIEKKQFLKKWDITEEGLLTKLNVDYEQN
jgi:hypothetical protein